MASRSYKLRLTVKDLKGLPPATGEGRYLVVQIEWKSPSKAARYFTRTGVQRNCTSKKCIQSDGTIIWNERFDHDCKLKLMDSQRFRSWFINLEVHATGQESNSRSSILAKTKIDVAPFASPAKNSSDGISIPMKCNNQGSKMEATLTVALAFSQMQPKGSKNAVYPLILPSLSSCIRLHHQPSSTGSQKPETSAMKDEIGDFRFASYRSTGSTTSGFLSDEELEFSYMNLASANLLQLDLLKSSLRYNKNEDWDEFQSPSAQFTWQTTLVRIISWNKKELSFNTLHHLIDTPLLNRAYGEEGGDDIDNERRCQFSTSKTQGENNFLDFRFPSSDRFEVGAWEERKLVSRDGKLELITDVFLASIDQRSEKAAGSSACTVLAAVIADWLHQNPKCLPLRCQFDKLIREGSSEWRHLCENEAHKEKFSDQHFDLDTVLQAKVRPLSLVSEKSFVGFFIPESMHEQLEFLQGVMSFDNIWGELQTCEASTEERVYIISWNDHFFVLKVEMDAIYIIDTLGERLFEGCNNAYIVKFNKESKLYRVKQKQNKRMHSQKRETCHKSVKMEVPAESCREIICEGKITCKEFIKGFLADLPLRELQADIKRGLIGEAPLHHRLQIEFHYTAASCTRSIDKQTETEHEEVDPRELVIEASQMSSKHKTYHLSHPHEYIYALPVTKSSDK